MLGMSSYQEFPGAITYPGDDRHIQEKVSVNAVFPLQDSCMETSC